MNASSCGAPPNTSLVYGGAPRSRLSELTTEQAGSIGQLVLSGSPRVCTAVLVTPNLAVTAGHCLKVEGGAVVQASAVVLWLGAGDAGEPSGVAAREVSVSATLDVGVVEVDPATVPFGIAPVALNEDDLSVDWVGSPAEFAGFGEDETGNTGNLRFAVERIVDYDEVHVVVDGEGRTGACAGDSGGPLLARSNDGSVRVVGILDEGDDSCVGRDYFTRSDLVARWLSVPDVLDTSCGGLDDLGSCVRGRAVWCENGSRRIEDCSYDHAVCGIEEGGAGFRCVAELDDQCAGRGATRVCEGNAVVGCELGGVKAQACGECRACEDWVDARGAGCTLGHTMLTSSVFTPMPAWR